MSYWVEKPLQRTKRINLEQIPELSFAYILEFLQRNENEVPKMCNIQHQFKMKCLPADVCAYCSCVAEVKEDRFTNPQWDLYYKAMFSYVLQFDLTSFLLQLQSFRTMHKDMISNLASDLIRILANKVGDNEKYQYLCVYKENESIPLYDGYLGVLLLAFKTHSALHNGPIAKCWIIKDSLKDELIELYNVCMQKATCHLPIISKTNPYLKGLPNSEDLYNGHHFLTGTACVGKSTFIRELESRGIKNFSRGFLGSFAGKSKCAISINNLYLALSVAHSEKNSLGDRGVIDNPLWVGIMSLCTPKYHDSPELFAAKCMDFIQTSFTNPWVGYYYLSCRGYVIIDLKPDETQKRLIKRGQNTDILRGRKVPFYSITQTLVYYAIARVMGWVVITSPYIDGVWSPNEYLKLIDFIEDDIKQDRPMKMIPDNFGIRKTEKTQAYEADLHYAKYTGIYK